MIVSLSLYVYHPCCVWKTLSWGSFITYSSYNLFFCTDLWTLRKGFNKDILLRTQCSITSQSAHRPVVGLCVSHHLLQKEASLRGLRDALTHLWVELTLLGMMVLLCFFNRIIVGFPLDPWHRSGLKFLTTLEGGRHEFCLMAWALNSTLKQCLVIPIIFVSLLDQYMCLHAGRSLL